jgi:hypothetical protein
MVYGVLDLEEKWIHTIPPKYATIEIIRQRNLRVADKNKSNFCLERVKFGIFDRNCLEMQYWLCTTKNSDYEGTNRNSFEGNTALCILVVGIL